MHFDPLMAQASQPDTESKRSSENGAKSDNPGLTTHG